MGIVDPGIGLVFWMLLGFVILVVFLSKFAWKPILKAVNDREESIENALNQAKKAREEMAELSTQNDTIVKQAKAERDAILKEAREMKDKIVSEAKGTAQNEGNKIIEAAKATIENEKQAAMTELRNQVANLSINIAEKVVKKELNEKDQQSQLVDTLIKEANLN